MSRPQYSRRELMCLALLVPFFAHAVLVAQNADPLIVTQFTPVDWIVGGGTLAFVVLALGFVLHRRWLPQFTLTAWSVALVLLLFEGGLRLVFPAAPANVPRPPMRFAADVGDALPGCRGTVVFSVNDLGLRGPQADPQSFDRRFLCVGGSTTECRYVTDEASWPWRFQDELAECLGESVFVGNAGLSGAAAAHHEHLIRNYAAIDDFDWAIVLCGTNDAGYHERNETYEQMLHDLRTGDFTSLTPAFGVDPPLRMYYRSSAWARLLHRLTNRPRGIIQDPQGDWIVAERALRKEVLARNRVETPSPDFETGLELYRRDLHGLIDACEEKDIRLLMLTQPTLYHEEMPAELEDLLYSVSMSAGEMDISKFWAYTPEVMERMMAAYNRVMLEVCRERGVDCIDLASKLPQDTSVFYTDCHFNDSGCEKIAAILRDYFCEKLRSAGPRSSGDDLRD